MGTKTNQKVAPPIKLLSILVLILLLGAGGYAYWHKHQNNSKSSSSASTLTAPEVLTTYKDDTYGFEFTYPKSWGDVSVQETAAHTGKQYGIIFLQKNTNSNNKIAAAISMDSNDLQAQFCKASGQCVTSGGITKSYIDQQLKAGSGYVEKDATSYTVMAATSQKMVSGLTEYQVVELPKINVSAVVISYQKAHLDNNCPSDRLVSDPAQNCMNTADLATISKLAKSFRPI